MYIHVCVHRGKERLSFKDLLILLKGLASLKSPGQTGGRGHRERLQLEWKAICW